MIKPIGDKVVLLPAPKETQTASGLHIPETAQEGKSEATVLAAGPGKADPQTGKIKPMSVKAGDTVWYNKYGEGMEVTVDGKDCIVVPEAAIYMVL